MPTTPYAKILSSVNGGALTAGWRGAIAGASTVQLQAESTSGWESARWEIVGYPKNWPTPSGWTLDADGIIYSTDYVPTLITLEAATTRWGKWIVRLKVNGGVKGGVQMNPEVIDETVGWKVLSPGLGLSEIAREESGQEDAQRRWVGTEQDNERAIEVAVGGDPIYSGRTSTTDATVTTLATVPIPDNSNAVIAVYATVKKAATANKAFFAYWQKVYRNGGGPTLWGTSPVDLGTDADGNPWTITFSLSGNNVLVRATGQAATTLVWKWQVKTEIATD